MGIKQSLKGTVPRFIILTNIIFLPLFLLVGLTMMLGLPTIISDAMLCIASWSSTFAFIILFKRIYSRKNFVDYVKSKFRIKIKLRIVILIIIMQTLIAILTIFMVSSRSVLIKWDFTISSFGMLGYYFLKNLFAGPLGEELGWRGFAQKELQKNHSPLKASSIIGFWWGMWHLPIWFTVGYTGINLIKYIMFFMIAIISISVIMATFYNLNNNLLIPIIIHQLFNFFIGITTLEVIELIKYYSILYFLVAIILIVINPSKVLYGNKVEDSIKKGDL